MRERVARWLAQRGDALADAAECADAALIECPGAGGAGTERVRALAAHAARPALVALCPAGMVEARVAALKAGADEALSAPVDLDELELALERALERRALTRPDAVGAEGLLAADPTPALLGASPSIRGVCRQIDKLATSRATVLLTGETGTGKELVAAAIHARSAQGARRMIKVNCAALPVPLLESELFGHERGAFTGAEQRRIGRFEEAHGSTLFLDEIGDMQLHTQAKVLRALQEREFERLGGTRPIRVDVRVIAATNQELGELVRAGRFREDLLFRLRVVELQLPPLRERGDDVLELAEAFLAEFAAGAARRIRGFEPSARAALCAHPWPGNVRELRNAVERGVLMGEGTRLSVADLGLGDPEALAPDPDGPLLQLPPGGIDFGEIERAALLQALERSHWVQKDAAALLRMSRRRLNYRIQRLGITHPGWRRNRADRDR